PTDEYGVGAYRNLELSNAGSSMLRWALAIAPGSSGQEAKVQRNPKNGFTLQTWNRKPQAKPTFRVTAKDAGVKSEGDVLEVQLNGPAFRLPAEFEVTWAADKLLLKVSKPAKLRLDYGALHPEWAGKQKPVLRRRISAGAPEVVRNDVSWNGSVVE